MWNEQKQPDKDVNVTDKNLGRCMHGVVLLSDLKIVMRLHITEAAPVVEQVSRGIPKLEYLWLLLLLTCHIIINLCADKNEQNLQTGTGTEALHITHTSMECPLPKRCCM